MATLTHLRSGIRCIVDNWWENMFAIDPWHPPSLLPGVDSLSGSEILKDLSGDWGAKFITAVFLPFIYIPALLYRWSIKSTFCFYWPILYVQTRRFKSVEDKHVFYQTLMEHPTEKLRLGLAIVTLLVLIYSTLSGLHFLDISSTNPVMIFPYLLAIDLHMIKPWQWFQLATAVLTMALWSKAWTVHIQRKVTLEYEKEFDWKPIPFMEWLSRLRNLTTWTHLFMGLVFIALYLPDTYSYLPDS